MKRIIETYSRRDRTFYPLMASLHIQVTFHLLYHLLKFDIKSVEVISNFI